MTNTCKAQLVDNQVNIYVEKLAGVFHGKDMVQENNFKYPSLYGNLKDMDGFSVKALYKFRENLSLGMGLASCEASGWEYADHLEYKNSTLKMKSMFPTIQFHSKFSEYGFLNRGKAFVEIAPVIGMSSFTMPRTYFTLFDIQNSTGVIPAPATSRDLFYGVKGNAGVEWAFSQSAGLVLSYSLEHSRVKSILFSDTYFTSSQLNIGLILKLKKDKRFLYR